ncbi:MAG: hypothetical protein AAFQ79_16975 [Pseudomonadota bacterium]
MSSAEKERLKAWASASGTTATDYIKGLIEADMAAGSPETRAAAWMQENASALDQEAEFIAANGIPGSDLALNHPWPDAEV